MRLSNLAQSPRFSAHLCDDHLVVVDQTRFELQVLNPAAALLWLLLDDARFLSTAELRSQLGEEAPADHRQSIQQAVDDHIAAWQALGWLEQSSAGFRLSRVTAQQPDPYQGRATPADPADIPEPHHLLHALHLCLNGQRMRVQLATTDKATQFPYTPPRLTGLLNGLRHPNPASALPCEEILLLADGPVFWIKTPQACLRSADESFAIARVLMAVLDNAYRHEQLFATLHAAATCSPSGTWVMPGASGRGKSTLNAWLTARGWGYLGDDVIALGISPLTQAPTVLPFPTALGIKQNSWPVLMADYPELENLPEIPYAHKIARFLPVQASPYDPHRCRIQGWLFPHFDADAAPALTPMSRMETFCALIDAGFTTGDRVDITRIGLMLDMLEHTPAYRMVFPTLEAAWVMMTTALPHPDTAITPHVPAKEFA